ncbi:MAG: hypothetical protein QOG64_5, partial [Acidimicrobiaceae bacterium]|nr:hypothetical protein [Acidimicrobiaceae bacterium]
MTVARGREDIGVVEARPRFGRIELPAIGMVAALGTTGV